jgi:hypothetical protein
MTDRYPAPARRARAGGRRRARRVLVEADWRAHWRAGRRYPAGPASLSGERRFGSRLAKLGVTGSSPVPPAELGGAQRPAVLQERTSPEALIRVPTSGGQCTTIVASMFAWITHSSR